jgi:hypothetical protein
VGALFSCVINVIYHMFNITASWHISETYSSYNEWETLDSTPFGQGFAKMLDMFVNPDKHQCDHEWIEDDEPQWFITNLNIHRGLFLIQDGHDTFSGKDKGEWSPLPKCRLAVRRPE